MGFLVRWYAGRDSGHYGALPNIGAVIYGPNFLRGHSSSFRSFCKARFSMREI